MTSTLRTGIAILLLGLAAGCGADSGSSTELLNVSYDPTRELWRDVNEQFIPAYKAETGTDITIKQSHGGSATQARAVVDGLDADVVTLAMWADTDQIREKGLIKEGWEDRLPHKSLPYFSTIVFVVREGNPKQIKDWGDLTRPGIEIITPNPKTSGNGKLSFLAAWGYIIDKGGSEDEARDFVSKIYRQTPVLDTGARGSTTTFAQKNIGDVHLTWENEAHLEVEESGGKLEIIYPSTSIRAEPHVAVVDENVDRRNTRAIAEAYLKFLYTDEGQRIIGKHHYRPSNETVLKEFSTTLPDIKLFSVTTIAKDWHEAGQRFFAEGGVFDSIYSKN